MTQSDIHPFPGLRAFQETEGLLFFGREGQSNAILKAMRRTRLLAVVGPSGSGKSSLIRAGLIPYLHGGFLEPAGSTWRIAVMRPGTDPIHTLASSIVQQELLEPKPDSPDDLRRAIMLTAATLRRGGLGLVETVRLARLPEGDNLLIVVDQFEELFRFSDAMHQARATDEAAAFVKLLLEASQQTQFPIYIVLTMRSDFIGECARFRDLPEIVTGGLYLVPRLTRAQRREVIEGPIRVANGSVTPRLVSRVLNDIGDDPDQLPILQHAMMRTWDHWLATGDKTRPVDLADYEAIGGASGALSDHADEAYGTLDARGQAIARKLFQCLTEKDADNRESRRPTRLCTIADVAEAAIPETIAVVEVFRALGRSFLMPPVPTSLAPSVVIDISHESLIRNWRRLRDWVDAEAESARIYRRLSETALLYDQGKAGLWRDPDLAVALAWREREVPSAAWAERYNDGWDSSVSFLDASRAARDAAIAAAQNARDRELRRNRSLMVAGALAVVLFGGLAWFGLYEAGAVKIALTEQQKALAEQERATALAEESRTVADAARRRAENGEQDAKAQAELARQREDEAKRQKAAAVHQLDIAQRSFSYSMALTIHFVTVMTEEKHYQQALDELSGWDSTLLDYNKENPNDRLFIPQLADLNNAESFVRFSMGDFAKAISLYENTASTLQSYIIGDPTFGEYRTKLIDTVLEEADALAKSNDGDRAINLLQSARAGLADFKPASEDIAKFGLAKAKLDLTLANTLKDAQDREPIYRDMLDWLTQSANAGNAEATHMVGWAYLKGKVGAPDTHEARKWFQKAADAGNVDAMYDLGWMLDNGKAGEPDPAGAFKWYSQAAAKGHVNAEINLGFFYETGRGTQQDSKEAAKWYRQAAETGSGLAENNLAHLYEVGQGVDRDELQAIELYRKASDDGYAPAAFYLGGIYENGTGGIAKNRDLALAWYTKAADGGDMNAAIRLGIIYHEGTIVPQDDKQAVKWYRRAADEGDPVGAYNLAHMYRFGLGVDQSAADELTWLQKSADGGYVGALFRLGFKYEQGDGVPPDTAKARDYYERAFKAGYAPAATELGILYLNGTGDIPKSVEQAIAWLSKAADAGEARAAFILGYIYHSGDGVQRDSEKARAFYEKAAGADDVDAMSKLAVMELDGAGGPRDVMKAVYWFQKAATAIEAAETKGDGKPGAKTAQALDSVGWAELFTKDFDKALSDLDRAHALAPEIVYIEGNRAHALMFLGRDDEARALYLKYRGTLNVTDSKTWEQSILADFDDFRRAGLESRLMNEIKSDFTAKP